MRGLITTGNLNHPYLYHLNQTCHKHQSFPYQVLICLQTVNVHLISIRSEYSSREVYKCDFDSSDCSGSLKPGGSKLFEIRQSYLTFKPSYYRITDFSSISKTLHCIYLNLMKLKKYAYHKR